MNYLISCLIIAFLFLVSLIVGVKDITWQSFLHNTNDEQSILIISRLPRTLALVLSGIGLSVAGFVMQQLAQNKFVSPSTIGTIDASKFGILISILLFPSYGLITKTIISFIVTALFSILFILLIQRVKNKNIIFVPLLGIMFGYIINAFATYFAFKNNIVQNMAGWLIGDFSSILQGNYESLYFIIPTVVMLYYYANEFVVLGMGESYAKNLGLNYQQVLLIGLICVSLTVSIIVVNVGAIPFVGLVVPNIVSMLYGDNLRRMLPLSALYGAIFLLVADIIGRLIIFPYELPIGLTIGVIGGIFFLIILLKRKN
ncbi:ABC transporter permease [Empedobacter brevis]|uniref:ABC transporter permease n=1 Tax=Empedobacter brevis TaxID=247 RepID=UPI0039AF95F3